MIDKELILILTKCLRYFDINKNTLNTQKHTNRKAYVHQVLASVHLDKIK